MMHVTLLPHPNLPAEFLEVRLDSDVDEPTLAIVKKAKDDNDNVAAASANTGVTLGSAEGAVCEIMGQADGSPLNQLRSLR